MNNQEVRSAINDFRKAFRYDLGAPLRYGKRVTSKSGGFSIDRRKQTLEWVDKTPTSIPLYGTVKSASQEMLVEAGLDVKSTAVITAIYEDILSIQTSGDLSEVLDDYIETSIKGIKQVYRIIDFNFAFQLKDTYVFVKFGVVELSKEEVEALGNR
jgi:hypothetical protein